MFQSRYRESYDFKCEKQNGAIAVFDGFNLVIENLMLSSHHTPKQNYLYVYVSISLSRILCFQDYIPPMLQYQTVSFQSRYRESYAFKG